ncbi:MAG: flavodoxin family protein [Methanomicrobiales archaeon]|nr:flavodoxin family protein [Methanomicrobiales archaeon]
MGSPRKNSSTHILANEAARALSEQGIPSQVIFLDDLRIHDCRGCHACKEESRDSCIIQDDMQEIYQLIDESAGIIVAAPVYFGYVPAQTKAWLDRLVPYIGMDMHPKITGRKKISFIFAQNIPDGSRYEQSLKGFMQGVAMTGLVVHDYLIATDCEAGLKTPVEERPDLMEKAYAIGRDLLG